MTHSVITLSDQREPAAGEQREREGHRRIAGVRAWRCPYDRCDGSGFVDDDATRTAVACECRPQRTAWARSRKVKRAIPRRFDHVGFDRNPVTTMDRDVVAPTRDYCDRIAERIETGQGIGFCGDRGTGKTTLAMLIAKAAIESNHAFAYYRGAELMHTIQATYRSDSAQSSIELIDQIASVDLLLLDDVACARPTDHTLEVFDLLVNRRYEDLRPIVWTADVGTDVPKVAEHIGERAFSRLVEMCGDPVMVCGPDQRLTYG